MLLGRYGIDLKEKEHNLMTIEYFNLIDVIGK